MTEFMYDCLMEHLDDLEDIGYPIEAVYTCRQLAREHEQVAIILYNYYFSITGEEN